MKLLFDRINDKKIADAISPDYFSLHSLIGSPERKPEKKVRNIVVRIAAVAACCILALFIVLNISPKTHAKRLIVERAIEVIDTLESENNVLPAFVLGIPGSVLAGAYDSPEFSHTETRYTYKEYTVDIYELLKEGTVQRKSATAVKVMESSLFTLDGYEVEVYKDMDGGYLCYFDCIVDGREMIITIVVDCDRFHASDTQAEYASDLKRLEEIINSVVQRNSEYIQGASDGQDE